MTSLTGHPPDPDTALLERFVAAGSESAFRQLVERYHGLVLSVARRNTGDEESARDVAQRVFALMARKAPQLRRHPALTGWLFTACRLECRTNRRDAARRARLMKEFAHHQAASEGSPEDGAFPAELLDEAMEQLPDADRAVLLARYYEGCSFFDIATARRVSEPAARKQVSRAMERLGRLLRGCGTTVAASALSPALASAYTPGPMVPPVGVEALASAALRAAPLLPVSVFSLFMTAKATLLTGAALLWIASLGAGWQAGVHSAPKLASSDPAMVAEAKPPRPALHSPLGRDLARLGESPRALALRDLIARIAADLEASNWDPVAKIRAQARLAAVSDADAAEALAVAMELPEPPSELLETLWRQRGQSEGLAAVEAAGLLPKGQLDFARQRALQGWAKANPSLALAWVLEQPERIAGGLESVFSSWAQNDAPAALAKALTLQDPDQRIAALYSYCKNSQDRTQSAKLMEAILESPESSRPTLLDFAVFQWEENPAGYAQWLTDHDAVEKYGRAMLPLLAYNWAGTDPAAAADWMWRTARDHGKYSSPLSIVIREWARVDAPAASEWLAAQPDGPELDSSIQVLIDALPPNEEEAANAWAARMHNRKIAEAVLRSRGSNAASFQSTP